MTSTDKKDLVKTCSPIKQEKLKAGKTQALDNSPHTIPKNNSKKTRFPTSLSDNEMPDAWVSEEKQVRIKL